VGLTSGDWLFQPEFCMLPTVMSHLGYLMMSLGSPMVGNLMKFWVTSDDLISCCSARSDQAWIQAITHKVNQQYCRIKPHTLGSPKRYQLTKLTCQCCKSFQRLGLQLCCCCHHCRQPVDCDFCTYNHFPSLLCCLLIPLH